MCWPRRIAEEIDRQGVVVRVTVIRAEGSTPREIGAAMLVGAAEIRDTVGGGALEFEAIAHARGLIGTGNDAAPWRREWRDFALGPSLGQCCGGYVRLLFERFSAHERPLLESLASAGNPHRTAILRPLADGVPLQAAIPDAETHPFPAAVSRALRGWSAGKQMPAAILIAGRKGEPDWLIELLAPPSTPLFIYGAGHVGRALVRVLGGLPFRVTWVDTDAARFPGGIPPRVAIRAAADPAALAESAPPGAYHIVMTYSHPLDLAICHALLKRGDFGHLGLIGSATKRARFLKRLRALGVAEASLARLNCPIGVPGIGGKQPAVIAIAVAAQLLQRAASDGRPEPPP